MSRRVSLRPQSPCGPADWCVGREGRFNAAHPEGQKQGDPGPTALDAPAPSANHEDQWIGLGRRTWLEHYPDFATVVALDDKKIGLAFIEDRPRRGAVERHQDSLRVAVPQRDL